MCKKPENMCNNVFEKAKRRAGKANRTSVYAEVAVRRVLSERCYEIFCIIHK